MAPRLLNAGYVPATYRRRLTDRTNAAKSPSAPRARQRNRTSGGRPARHDPPSPTRALRIATEQKYKHPLAAAARIGGAAATTPAPTIASCSSPDLAGCQALPPHLLHPRTCHGPDRSYAPRRLTPSAVPASVSFAMAQAQAATPSTRTSGRHAARLCKRWPKHPLAALEPPGAAARRPPLASPRGRPGPRGTSARDSWPALQDEGRAMDPPPA